MDKKHEVYLKATVEELFTLAAQLCYSAEDLASFYQWVRTEILGDERQ